MADLNALLIFAKVVDARSFSEAARRLHQPISSVSRRVSDLERELGVRLLERSTRSLRLTDSGADVLQHAQRGAELSDAVDNIVSYQRTNVSGLLRLSAPSGIAHSLLPPLTSAFQAANPNVRIHVVVTERLATPAIDGVDLGFRIGSLRDSSLIARRILTYRHLLVASPDYLARHTLPEHPRELLALDLLAFSCGEREHRWSLTSTDHGTDETVTFQPTLAMNDYTGLTTALCAGAGVGELPPMIAAELLRDGRLAEILPAWRFRPVDLSLVHAGGEGVPRAVRAFKEFAVKTAPALFPTLPT